MNKKGHDFSETKKRETENLRAIKPESSISTTEVDDFWKNIDFNNNRPDFVENKNISPESKIESLAHSHSGSSPILDTVTSFFKSFASKDEEKDDEELLKEELQKNLPDKTPEEIDTISKSIISTVAATEANKVSLSDAIKHHQTPEDWFFSKTKDSFSSAPSTVAAKNLSEVDTTLRKGNIAMYKTLSTKTGEVNMNPRLDGYIAEQHHVQTFNFNAEAAGSNYRAKVLEPAPGETYGKNSVDVVIYDKENPSVYVRKYQAKYGKDASATEALFEKGDYRGQTKLVPDGQETLIKNSTNVIESPDGIKSNPLSKADAEKLRDAAQEGKWRDLDWNNISTKDLVKGIGKQAGIAGVLAATLCVGIDVGKKLITGEEIKLKDEALLALEGGLTGFSAVAMAGALKVCSEKGLIALIPKGTPVDIITTIAVVAIEDIKVLYRIAKGELSLSEGIEALSETTLITAAGMFGAFKGSALATAAAAAIFGSALGPIGALIAGFIGGIIGFIVGSEIAEKIVEIAQDIKDFIVEKWNEFFGSEQIEQQSAETLYLPDGKTQIELDEAIRISESLQNQLNQEISLQEPVV